MSSSDSLRHFLARIRVENGLSQERLAEKVGLSRTSVRDYESGAISNLRVDVLAMWVDACSLNGEQAAAKWLTIYREITQTEGVKNYDRCNSEIGNCGCR